MRTILLFLLCCVVIGLGVRPAYPEDPSEQEIGQMIDDEKSELEQLKSKIKKQAREISSMGKKESKILKTLESLDDKKKVRERELQIYRWNIQINKKKMGQLSRKIKKTEKHLSRQESMMGQRLRTLYKEGKVFPVKVLFSAEDYNDLIQKIKYMEMLMSHDSRIFERYQERWKQFKEEEKQLSQAKTKLVQFEKAALKKKSEIEQERLKKSRFLKKIEGKKVYFIQTRKELLKASENLNHLIARLEEKRVSGEGLTLADQKGRLTYPVQGRITNRFGRVRSPQFGSYIIHNGLNMKVSKGTKVFPIYRGKVLFAGPLEGYGNLVIVGHGEQYHSLYGHLDRISVHTGDHVYVNRPLGLSGDSGSLVGETLYLELRHQGKPIDPAPWLKLAKRN